MYYHSDTFIYFNGEFVKASEAKIDLFGQSLHYGNAVFEGIRAYHTAQGPQVFKAREHFERLLNSCKKMHLNVNYSVDSLIKITYRLLELNQLPCSYIRPLVFAGPNMTLKGSGQVNIMLAAWEWGNYLGNDPLDIMISSFRRPNAQAFFMEAKIAGHYVNSILASTEAHSKGFDDALLLDDKGYISEGPAANIFFEKDDKLFTPPLGNILPGITRATVFEIVSEMGVEVIEKNILPEELMEADGAFFTSTAIEISGINSLNRNKFRKKWEHTLGYQIELKYKQRVLLNEYVNYVII